MSPIKMTLRFMSQHPWVKDRNSDWSVKSFPGSSSSHSTVRLCGLIITFKSNRAHPSAWNCWLFFATTFLILFYSPGHGMSVERGQGSTLHTCSATATSTHVIATGELVLSWFECLDNAARSLLQLSTSATPPCPSLLPSPSCLTPDKRTPHVPLISARFVAPREQAHESTAITNMRIIG